MKQFSEQQLADMSLDELKKEQKKLSRATGLFLGVMLVLVVTGLILAFTKGSSILPVASVAFFPMIVLLSTNLKKIKAEISARG